MTRHSTIRLVTLCASLLVFSIISFGSAARADSDDGIVRVKSAVPMAEAITRIKADIASKGIKFFMEIDQSKLAADAGIKLRPSTLLVFGNPPLGTQFITSNPNAGLDWPVRLLLTQDDNGDVWRCGPISAGSPNATTSGIASRSSRWRPRWSVRSLRPSRPGNTAGSIFVTLIISRLSTA